MRYASSTERVRKTIMAKIFSISIPQTGTWSAIQRAYNYCHLRFRYLKYLLIGTKISENEWATRHLRGAGRSRDDWGKGCDDWIEGYWNSQSHPHRSFLVNTISKFNPSSILEVGCNCGPNLYLLARRFPDAEIVGVDINPEAIQRGKELLKREGISNITLLEGKADDLGRFQDKSFDVVFTDAILIYIGQDKIRRAVSEMLRVGSKALVLIEWYNFDSDQRDPDGLGVYYKSLWKRDYKALLKQFVREEQITVTKITEDLWPSTNWCDVGAVVEVVM
jgi:ubiquinone/menaquinone biosynthesis C-methylase UbiE